MTTDNKVDELAILLRKLFADKKVVRNTAKDKEMIQALKQLKTNYL